MLADEARRLLAALPAAHDHVFYTATSGRLDRAALVALGLPVDAQAYLCGPTGFMDAMTAALTDLGLRSDRIHTERFTSLTAINPGVVGAARPAPHAPAKPGSGPMVTFARAGLTVAFDESAASLLEMAEACDVPTRWSCRTGVCHTCSTPLLVRRGRLLAPTAHRTRPRRGAAVLRPTAQRRRPRPLTPKTAQTARVRPGRAAAEPARYSSSGTSSSAHACSTGSTIRHSSSASSPRMDSVGSPSRISLSSRL